MKPLLIAFFLWAGTSRAAPEENHTHLIDVIYWETKPFIFTNSDGELDGIIPHMFEEAQYYCMKNTSKKLVKFAQKLSSRKGFYELTRNDTNYGEGLLLNISKNKAFWAPLLSRTGRRTRAYESKKGLKSFQLFKTTEIAIVVPRYFVSLPNKILRGIISCQPIFLIAFILSAVVSVLIWLIEHFNNEAFQDSFIKGVGIGLWWSVVSMTTVGYGDVKIKSVLGRLVAVIWLFFGVMIACIITATMTDVVAGLADFTIAGKTVSVLQNSYDELAASEDYSAITVPVESYEDALQLVRDGKVFAAMINGNVAAWNQNEITNDDASVPLRIVQSLPANLHVNCYTPTDVSDELKDVFKCMYLQRQEVYTSSIERFHRYCHKEILYTGSIKDMCEKNKFIQVTIAIVCAMFTLGLAYEMYYYKYKKTDMSTITKLTRRFSDSRKKKEKEQLV